MPGECAVNKGMSSFSLFLLLPSSEDISYSSRAMVQVQEV